MIDIEQYVGTSREGLKTKLIEKTRLISALEKERLAILFSMSNDEERNKKVLALMKRVHKALLESSLDVSLDIILTETLTEEEFNFLMNNKNKRYYSSGEVFEEHKLHPIQKDLVKEGHLSKREINTKKTPNQHIIYLKGRKDLSEYTKRMEERMNNLENELSVVQNGLISLHSNQMMLGSVLAGVIESVNILALKLKDKVKDARKVSAWVMKNTKKPDGKYPSYTEVANALNMGRATVVRWIGEIDDLIQDDQSLASLVEGTKTLSK